MHLSAGRNNLNIHGDPDFGALGGLNRIERAATLSVHKSHMSSYRLAHTRSELRRPPIRPGDPDAKVRSDPTECARFLHQVKEVD
jgi:hypothetical protein